MRRPSSSEEYSNNRVYYLWSAIYIQNTELITTLCTICLRLLNYLVLRLSLPALIIRWRNWGTWGLHNVCEEVQLIMDQSKHSFVLFRSSHLSLQHSLPPWVSLCLHDCCQNNKEIQQENEPAQFLIWDNSTKRKLSLAIFGFVTSYLGVTQMPSPRVQVVDRVQTSDSVVGGKAPHPQFTKKTKWSPSHCSDPHSLHTTGQTQPPNDQ